MKETNKLILVAIIPSIFTFVLTSVASSSLQQIGDSIADSFSKKKPYAQAQIEPSDTILENDSFILTADGSIDPDGGRIISYTWLQNNGHGFEALRLSETNKSTANFAAPNVINDTPLSFKLIVKDDEGSENNANVTVTIETTSSI